MEPGPTPAHSCHGEGCFPGRSDMSETIRVDVGVCTFRRAAVAETLASVGAQALPDHIRLRVIVADNDETPSAEAVVRAAAEAYGLDLVYVHAPSRNISLARNACLEAASGDF